MQFLNEFTSIISLIDKTNSDIIIAGDYNINILKIYGSIVSSLHNAADGNIPTNDINSGSGPHAITGWNERVKSAHALARDAFKCWIISGKARQGTEYEEMKTSRSNFKYILRM